MHQVEAQFGDYYDLLAHIEGDLPSQSVD